MEVNACKWMCASECIEVNACKWMHASECMQVNACKWMNIIEWNRFEVNMFSDKRLYLIKKHLQQKWTKTGLMY